MNSAAGQSRATAYLRGAPLPPLGSFHERLVYESQLREKNEKFALVSLFATLLGHVGGMNEQWVDSLLEEYKEELYQLRYNSKYKTARQRLISTMVSKAAEESRLLRKVEAIANG